jgi:hypothetical protein
MRCAHSPNSKRRHEAAKSSGLTNITISDGVTNIESSASENCTSLTRVVIPSSVSNIAGGAFAQCTGLRSILFQGNAPGAEESMFVNDYGATAYLSLLNTFSA